eukprot:CAMPEP_0184706560 /NCGR_PEP_ID=MMETSP0313-20130426/36819_1 /TAXON_ID=2792 /ORGANISM="Porphyridium aerugineum, Strain SAG 1380-2" /LENGTH=2368 /DNA_ID=CAMNT_0027168117 /DNA_START=74 /DNA_END=7179 /DNA_ORIENTATION=-
MTTAPAPGKLKLPKEGKGDHTANTEGLEDGGIAPAVSQPAVIATNNHENANSNANAVAAVTAAATTINDVATQNLPPAPPALVVGDGEKSPSVAATTINVASQNLPPAPPALVVGDGEKSPATPLTQQLHPQQQQETSQVASPAKAGTDFLSPSAQGKKAQSQRIEEVMDDPIENILRDEPEQLKNLMSIDVLPLPDSRAVRNTNKLTASKYYRRQNQISKNVQNKVDDIMHALQTLAGSASEKVEDAGHKIGTSDIKQALSGRKKTDEDQPEPVQEAVDTEKKVDLVGTEIHDLQEKIEEERLKGANVVDSPLNTPWLLMIFPVAPLGIMYTYTVLKFVLPPMLVLSIWLIFLFPWKVWLFFFCMTLLGILLSWPALSKVEALKPITLPINLALLEMQEKILKAWEKQEPIAREAFNRYFWNHLFPHLEKLDQVLYERYKFSLFRTIGAWNRNLKYDELIKDVLPFKSRFTEEESGPEFEDYYRLEITFESIREIYSKDLKAVWVDLELDGVTLDGLGQQDVVSFPDKGDHGVIYPTDNEDVKFSMAQEIRLPYFPGRETDDIQEKFDDAPIHLKLRGRKTLPLYCNDGGPRYLKGQDIVYDIGECVLSAKRIGCGLTRVLNEERHAEVRIPFYTKGFEDYHVAVGYAKTTVSRISNSSYSYREKFTDLPSGDWSCRINLFELRALAATDESATSDPYIVVKAFGQEKRSRMFRATLSCVVDEMLFFNQAMTGREIEDAKVAVAVYDWNRFGAPNLIGQIEFDVSNVYRTPSHEFFRRWIALYHPEKGSNARGYLKMSMGVVGPNDSPPKYHAESEDREEFSRNALLKNEVVKAPMFVVRSYVVHCTIGWADMITRMTGELSQKDVIRGYLEVEYTGFPNLISQTFIGDANTIVDDMIDKDVCKVNMNRQVAFNEEFLLPMTTLNGKLMVDGVKISLRHRTHSMLTTDKYIGEIHISLMDLVRYSRLSIVRGDPADGESPGDRLERTSLVEPRWFNFYGKPGGTGSDDDRGTNFRGRLLVGVAAKSGRIRRPFSRPCLPPVRPKTCLYKLEFQVCRATELPLDNNWLVAVECKIGLYEFGQTIPRVAVRNKCVQWDELSMIRINFMQLPELIEDIPDVFVTLWKRKPRHVTILEQKTEDGALTETDAAPKTKSSASLHGHKVEAEEQWTRFAFLRLPAAHLVHHQPQAKWMFMDFADQSSGSDESAVPGSLLMNCHISRMEIGIEEVCELKDYDRVRAEKAAKEAAAKANPDEDKASTMRRRRQERMERSQSKDTAATAAAGQAEELDKEKTPEELAEIEKEKRVLALKEKISKLDPAGTFTPALGEEKFYELRALIIKGRNLPAADLSGLSDPLFSINVGDQSSDWAVYCHQTHTPVWEAMVSVKNISVRSGQRFPNVNIMIKDYDNDMTFDYLGRAIISSCDIEADDPDPSTARWYPVFSLTPERQIGEILADFQIKPMLNGPEEVVVTHQDPVSLDDQPLSSLLPRKTALLRVAVVGLEDLRFLRYPLGQAYLESTVTRLGSKAKSRSGVIMRDRDFEANASILDVLMLPTGIPEDFRFAESVNFFIHVDYNYRMGEPALLGATSVDLGPYLPALIRNKKKYEDLKADKFGMDDPVPIPLIKMFKYQVGTMVKRSIEVDIERQIGPDINNRIDLNHGKVEEIVDENDLGNDHLDIKPLKVGYPEIVLTKKQEQMNELMAKLAEINLQMQILQAKIRKGFFDIFGAISEVMPDVALRLGLPESYEEPLLIELKNADDELAVSTESTAFIRKERGSTPDDLERTIFGSIFGEIAVHRGDSRESGVVSGESLRSNAIDVSYELNEGIGEREQIVAEKRLALLEGNRPVVGKIKARFDLIEMPTKNGLIDDADLQKARLASLRNFGRLFAPTEVVVRVYVLRGISLQQIDNCCNSYVVAKFFGGFPQHFTTKYNPVLNTDNPNYFVMFESRVKLPGGQLRLEVKDRQLPKQEIPIAYPWYVSGPDGTRFGMVQKDIPLDAGALGLGWSANIGDTEIDLDQRWYNPHWRQLKLTPVEARSLWLSDSINVRGKLELFIDMIEAVDYDARPLSFKPAKIRAPEKKRFMMRVVVFKVMDAYLPYMKSQDPNKMANFYVQLQVGNREEDIRKTDICKFSSDGKGQWNWRTSWWLELPDTEIKPRLKISVLDDTSMGFGQDDMCATADIKLRSLFDELLEHNEPILKKRQWIILGHPNYPQIDTKVELAIEILPEESVALKKCGYGVDSWKLNQDEDYILPHPFRPVQFSLYNPAPFINYQIMAAVNNIQWQLATYLLPFPFLPMFLQFVWMTPWWWYGMGGVAGLIIFLRVFLLEMARYERMRQEEKKLAEQMEEEESDENKVIKIEYKDGEA